MVKEARVVYPNYTRNIQNARYSKTPKSMRQTKVPTIPKFQTSHEVLFRPENDSCQVTPDIAQDSDLLQLKLRLVAIAPGPAPYPIRDLLATFFCQNRASRVIFCRSVVLNGAVAIGDIPVTVSQVPVVVDGRGTGCLAVLRSRILIVVVGGAMHLRVRICAAVLRHD